MATRRYSVPPSGNLEQVVEAPGAAVVTSAVELTVDMTAVVYDKGVYRKISRTEVLQAIDALEEYITRANWPPV
jgi:hypothetical protein